MKRDFLKNLGLEDAVINQILDENSRDIGREKQRADSAAADLAGLREQIAARDYADAVKKAVSGKDLHFSSKAAERDFMARLQEKKLEMQDGALVGLDQFVQEQMETDPDAFASGRPLPRFVAPAGVGGAPTSPLPPNVARAKEMGAEKAAALRTSQEVMKNFF